MSDALSAISGGGTNSGDEELESEHQAVDDIERGEVKPADEDQKVTRLPPRLSQKLRMKNKTRSTDGY